MLIVMTGTSDFGKSTFKTKGTVPIKVLRFEVKKTPPIRQRCSARNREAIVSRRPARQTAGSRQGVIGRGPLAQDRLSQLSDGLILNMDASSSGLRNGGALDKKAPARKPQSYATNLALAHSCASLDDGGNPRCGTSSYQHLNLVRT